MIQVKFAFYKEFWFIQVFHYNKRFYLFIIFESPLEENRHWEQNIKKS